MNGIPYICKYSFIAEHVVQQEAVMEQNVIYVVLFIPKEKKNLYAKNPEKFI